MALSLTLYLCLFSSTFIPTDLTFSLVAWTFSHQDSRPTCVPCSARCKALLCPSLLLQARKRSIPRLASQGNTVGRAFCVAPMGSPYRGIIISDIWHAFRMPNPGKLSCVRVMQRAVTPCKHCSWDGNTLHIGFTWAAMHIFTHGFGVFTSWIVDERMHTFCLTGYS